ncbi:MAG: Entericidin EcnA/B family protein [Erythrobacter sp.]
MVRKSLIAIALATLTLASTACNTVRGVGQDLESVADDVDEAI